jgi:hypothetical protein
MGSGATIGRQEEMGAASHEDLVRVTRSQQHKLTQVLDVLRVRHQMRIEPLAEHFDDPV